MMMFSWIEMGVFLKNETGESILTRLGLFAGFILLSFLIGRYTPWFLRITLRRFLPHQAGIVYDNLLEPIRGILKVFVTIILISLSLKWLEQYQQVYDFLQFIADFAVIASAAWLASRLLRQILRVYAIAIVQSFGQGIDESLNIIETVINVLIGMIAVLTFANQRFDLFGIFAGLGISGIAIAFAAQKTLEQIIGTIVLYLDRPFLPGEYIRIPSSSRLLEEVFGRVESIGLRSTKIRIAAKSTLLIVPNSILATLEIENITRGKKIMVLLNFNFTKLLDEREEAIVRQIIQSSTDLLFGIDPGSTNIAIVHEQEKSRARVTFFILGSTESSIQLRKRLLELANDEIFHQFKDYGIAFSMQEPNLYVEAPVTI